MSSVQCWDAVTFDHYTITLQNIENYEEEGFKWFLISESMIDIHVVITWYFN